MREKNVQQPLRSRRRIWHSVMCVLNRETERRRETRKKKERWTDCRIEGDMERKSKERRSKVVRGNGKWR